MSSELLIQAQLVFGQVCQFHTFSVHFLSLFHNKEKQFFVTQVFLIGEQKRKFKIWHILKNSKKQGGRWLFASALQLTFLPPTDENIWKKPLFPSSLGSCIFHKKVICSKKRRLLKKRARFLGQSSYGSYNRRHQIRPY